MKKIKAALQVLGYYGITDQELRHAYRKHICRFGMTAFNAALVVVKVTNVNRPATEQICRAIFKKR